MAAMAIAPVRRVDDYKINHLESDEIDSLRDLVKIIRFKLGILPPTVKELEDFLDLKSHQVIQLFDRCMFPTAGDKASDIANRIASKIFGNMYIEYEKLPELEEMNLLARYLRGKVFEDEILQKDWFPPIEILSRGICFRAINDPKGMSLEAVAQMRNVIAEAVKQGKIEVVKLFSKFGALQMLYPFRKGGNPDISFVELAAAYCQPEIVDYYIDCGGSVNTSGPIAGSNPLELALGLFDQAVDRVVETETREAMAIFLREKGAICHCEMRGRKTTDEDFVIRADETSKTSLKFMNAWLKEHPRIDS